MVLAYEIDFAIATNPAADARLEVRELSSRREQRRSTRTESPSPDRSTDLRQLDRSNGRDRSADGFATGVCEDEPGGGEHEPFLTGAEERFSTLYILVCVQAKRLFR